MPLNMGCCTMKGEVGFSQHKPFVLCLTQIMVLRHREDLLVTERIFFITEETATAMEGEVGLPNFRPSAMYAYEGEVGFD
jgi:hypothetical protein